MTCGFLRFGPLDFAFGFRVKEVDTIDFEGIDLYLEDHEEGGEVGTAQARVIKQGVLRKLPSTGFGSHKRRMIVLDSHRLRWYRQGDDPEKCRVPRGSMLLKPWGTFVSAGEDEEASRDKSPVPRATSPTASTNGATPLRAAPASPPSSPGTPSTEGFFRVIVVEGKNHLTLVASSKEERDEWASAIAGAIDMRKRLVANQAHAWASNSQWIEGVFAEIDSEFMRKVHRAERRRRDWRRRWCGSKAERDEEEDRSHGSHGSHLEDEEQDEGSAQGSAASMRSLRTSAFAGRNLPGTEFISKMSDTLQSMQESLRQHATRALEKNRSQQSEERVDEAVDWQIGRLSVKGLNVTLNKKQRLTLGEDGWTLRGFVGSGNELQARLLFHDASARFELGLAAKLIRDSGASTAVNTVLETVKQEAGEALREYTGRASYQFGDITKATWNRMTGKSDGKSSNPPAPVSVVKKVALGGDNKPFRSKPPLAAHSEEQEEESR